MSPRLRPQDGPPSPQLGSPVSTQLEHRLDESHAAPLVCQHTGRRTRRPVGPPRSPLRSRPTGRRGRPLLRQPASRAASPHMSPRQSQQPRPTHRRAHHLVCQQNGRLVTRPECPQSTQAKHRLSQPGIPPAHRAVSPHTGQRPGRPALLRPATRLGRPRPPLEHHPGCRHITRQSLRRAHPHRTPRESRRRVRLPRGPRSFRRNCRHARQQRTQRLAHQPRQMCPRHRLRWHHPMPQLRLQQRSLR